MVKEESLKYIKEIIITNLIEKIKIKNEYDTYLRL